MTVRHEVEGLRVKFSKNLTHKKHVRIDGLPW